MHCHFEADGQLYGVSLVRWGDAFQLRLASGWKGIIALDGRRQGRCEVVIDGRAEPIAYAIDGDALFIHHRGRAYGLRYVDPIAVFSNPSDDAGHHVARAPMPGVVVSVKVVAGEPVSVGTVLLVIESMKLETAVRSPRDGVVAQVHVGPGDSFERDASLVTLSEDNA